MNSASGSNQSVDNAVSFPLLAVLAMAAGAIYPLSFAPFQWFPLFCLGRLLLVAVESRFLSLGIVGLDFGLGKYGVGVSWVYVGIHQYSEPRPHWLAAWWRHLLLSWPCFVCPLAGLLAR